MTEANNPELKSWVEVAKNSDFPIQNLPFGIFKKDENYIAVGVAIGDYILDLSAIDDAGLFASLGLPKEIFKKRFINDFISLGRDKTSLVRNYISELLGVENQILRDNEVLRQKALLMQNECEMLMPVKVGDYTDFLLQ